MPEDPLLPTTSRRLGDKYKKNVLQRILLLVTLDSFWRNFFVCSGKNGDLFQDLFPTKENKDKLSSESSEILLDFHSEVAFHPFQPDFLMLYCLRSDLL